MDTDGVLINGPLKSICPTFDHLEEVYWHIPVHQTGQNWHDFTGEALIFQTDSREVFAALLYGLNLTYVSIDQEIVDAFRKELQKWGE